MTVSERIIIRNGHPRRIIVGVIMLIWTLYFLWFHNWVGAAIALILGVPLSRLAAREMHEEQLAQTTFGKILLLHLHPANVIVQAIGFAILLWSVSIHSGGYIALSVSVILLGHMWGWHKVNQALRSVVLILWQDAFGTGVTAVVDEIIGIPSGTAGAHLGQPRPDVLRRATNPSLRG